MIVHTLKLRLTKHQDQELTRWLYHLAPVYNFAVRKIELNAANKIYFQRNEFMNILAGHGEKLGIPSHVLRGTLDVAWITWQRCFKKLSKKPRLKSFRNKLNSISFPDPIKPPKGNRIALPGIGSLRFHRMDIPQGKIKCGRICKRASGWYLCLFIDAVPKAVEHIADGVVGVDPGFKSLLTLSTGAVVEHPREYENAEKRLAQAQRGNNHRLVGRIFECVANRRKDRNHKLSRKLVAENAEIYFSCDSHTAVARRFGKSVSSSSHYQLRQMISYKSACSGRIYVEVTSKFSTKTCSECGRLSGPSGLTGLSVRKWKCPCGTEHDRDVNAARNTLISGAGSAHEVHGLST